MKKLFSIFAFLATAAFGQVYNPGSSSGGGGLTPATFASPPAHKAGCSAVPQPSGCSYLFSDASAAGGTTGGGSFFSVLADNGTSFAQTSQSSTGGTGSAATQHSTAFNATPTDSCASASTGVVDSFTFTGALTGNVTIAAINTCTRGQLVYQAYTQAATGGPYTVTEPSGWDACSVSPTASVVTTCGWYWDGTTGHLASISTSDAPSIMFNSTERADPGSGNCPGGGCNWPDSTTHNFSFRNSSNVVFGYFKTGQDCNPATGQCTKSAGTSFGTAAFQNTGTSGANVPLLNAANTWGATQVMTHLTVEGVTSTGATGTGNLVFGTSPSITTPNLGIPSALDLTNATKIPLTLTTTGTSGASAYTQSTNTLNVPQYSGGGGAGASLFSTTNSTTVTATSATTLIGTVTGSTTVPINTFAAGQFLQVISEGYYTTPATPASLTISILIGGTIRVTTGAVVQIASITNGVWRLNCGITTRTTGSSGTQIANCIFEGTGATLTPGEAPLFVSSSWTIDTTATQAIDIQATWSTATGSPSITSTNIAAFVPGAPVTSFTGDGTLISNSSSTGGVTATLATAGAHKWFGNNTGSTAAPGYQSLGTADLPVAINTRTQCDVLGADNASAALANGDLGPQTRQYMFSVAMTLVEVTVSADAGTPNIQINKNHTGTQTNILSGVLATAASGAVACASTAAACIDGTAKSGTVTISTTAIAAGDWLELTSGTAGGTAKRMTVCWTGTVN